VTVLRALPSGVLLDLFEAGIVSALSATMGRAAADAPRPDLVLAGWRAAVVSTKAWAGFTNSSTGGWALAITALAEAERVVLLAGLTGLGWDAKSSAVSMSARLVGGLGRGMMMSVKSESTNKKAAQDNVRPQAGRIG